MALGAINNLLARVGLVLVVTVPDRATDPEPIWLELTTMRAYATRCRAKGMRVMS